MKTLILVTLSLLTFNTFANEVYKCDFTGPDYVLTFHDNEMITLQNSFKSYNCEKGFENFPGTEIDLHTLLCGPTKGGLKFYITQYSDNEIILSRNVIFAKDISCKKQ